jgi:hypothetical protein
VTWCRALRESDAPYFSGFLCVLHRRYCLGDNPRHIVDMRNVTGVEVKMSRALYLAGQRGRDSDLCNVDLQPKPDLCESR